MPYEYTPVTFGSLGAFGSSARSWWRKMVKLDRAINCTEGCVSPVLGPEYCTWSARRFSSYWLQRISFAMALALAEAPESVLLRSVGYGAA